MGAHYNKENTMVFEQTNTILLKIYFKHGVWLVFDQTNKTGLHKYNGGCSTFWDEEMICVDVGETFAVFRTQVWGTSSVDAMFQLLHKFITRLRSGLMEGHKIPIVFDMGQHWAFFDCSFSWKSFFETVIKSCDRDHTKLFQNAFNILDISLYLFLLHL